MVPLIFFVSMMAYMVFPFMGVSDPIVKVLCMIGMGIMLIWVEVVDMKKIMKNNNNKE